MAASSGKSIWPLLKDSLDSVHYGPKAERHSCNHTKVVFTQEFAAFPELYRRPIKVFDHAADLFEKQAASGVIPDLSVSLPVFGDPHHHIRCP